MNTFVATPFLRYAGMVIANAFKKFTWGRDLTISTLIAFLTFVIQRYGGIGSSHDTKILVISIIAPYVVVLSVHVVYRLIRSPYDLYVRAESELNQSKSEIDSKVSEIKKLKGELENIGGPKLVIGFDRSNWANEQVLVVINHGGGWAHDVQLKIPGDRCGIVTKAIPVLRDDGSVCAWQAGETNRVTAADIIMSHANESVAVLTCNDDEGRRLAYDFQPLEKLAGYKFVSKHHLGRNSTI